MVLFKITIPQGASEFKLLEYETKRIIFDEGPFTEVDSRFTIKPVFSTLGSFIEISRQRPLISFLPDDSIQNLLGFNASTIKPVS